MARIAVDFASSATGGGLRYATEVLPRLMAHPDLDVVAGLVSPALADELSALPGTIVAGRRWESYAPSWQRRIRRLKPDTLFVATETGFAPTGVRTVLVLQNVKNALPFRKWAPTLSSVREIARRRLARKAILRADHLIAVSLFAQRVFEEALFPRPIPPIDVVRHGVSIPTARDDRLARASASSSGQPRKLAWVSNLSPHKNIEVLEAACRFLPAKSVEISLIGHGFSTRYGKGVVAAFAHLRPGIMFRVVGAVPPSQAVRLIAEHDALVWTSTLESFALPTVEAAVVGTHVIAPNHPLFHELLGNTPWYYEPSDPRGLAETILEFCNTSPTAVGELPFDYTWERTANELAAILAGS